MQVSPYNYPEAVQHLKLNLFEEKIQIISTVLQDGSKIVMGTK